MNQKIKDFLSDVYRISGRASQSEFWKKMLWILLADLAFVFIMVLMRRVTDELYFSGHSIISFTLSIYLFCVSIALWVAQACIMMRRAQDLGWNRWFIVGIFVVCTLLSLIDKFIPYIVSMFAILIWIALPFVVGLLQPQMSANQYGEYQEDTEDFRPYFKKYLFIYIGFFLLCIAFVAFVLTRYY